MVRAVGEPNTVADYRMRRRPLAKGFLMDGKPSANIRFPQYLFDKIRAEAERHGWSFNRMVIHLCEASIEGIE